MSTYISGLKVEVVGGGEGVGVLDRGSFLSNYDFSKLSTKDNISGHVDEVVVISGNIVVSP